MDIDGFLFGEIMETKTCSKCKDNKNIKDFYKHSKEKDGLYSQCKKCAEKTRKEKYYLRKDKYLEYARKYKDNNREKIREYARQQYKDNKSRERSNRLKREYGISLNDYNEMYEKQNGLCAICETPSDKSFHVDHDHNSGEVRGLLCGACNKALGFVKDDIGILERMKRYLNANH